MLSGIEKVKIHQNIVLKNCIVSVCVQTYNHEKYLSDCLDSILKQKTNFNFEILLGEDGSNDKTRQICIQYAERFPDIIKLFIHNRKNVIYLNGKPTGRYNMLFNLQSAAGKYFSFCAGDDYWTDHNKLQFQVDFMENNPECFMITHALAAAKPGTHEGWYDMKKLYQHYYLPHASNYLIRRFDLEKYKAPLLTIPGGETCLLYIAASEGLIFHSSKEVSFYRTSSGGIHNSLNMKNRVVAEINQNRLLFKYFKIDRQPYLRRVVSNYKRAKKQGLRVNVRLRYYIIIEKIYGYYLAGMIRIKSFF
jgi:glycosyltransferase involved in cell wall biosynthesis